MSKIQKLNFRNIGDFLDYLPDKERKIVIRLREIIFDCIPDVKEKLAYNVPFYYRHKRICYIWPSSVPWGGLANGVAIGFSKGYLLEDPDDYLAGKDKKEIRMKVFQESGEIEANVLTKMILEAVECDRKLK